jgi:hypothetical protein
VNAQAQPRRTDLLVLVTLLQQRSPPGLAIDAIDQFLHRPRLAYPKPAAPAFWPGLRKRMLGVFNFTKNRLLLQGKELQLEVC